MTNEKTRKVAIVTYNRIGSGAYDNGVLEENNVELHIAQHGHKAKWAYEDKMIGESSISARSRAANSVGNVGLSEMDYSYIYVGARGGEGVISQTSTISAEKIAYVMCNCNWNSKLNRIARAGNSDAEIIRSECGGRETLERIAKKELGK